jgi:hypothetical protein
MPDPLTLTAANISAVALTEGVKFLYTQAGEVLKRWRERKEKVKQESVESPQTDELILTSSPPPAVFDADVSRLKVQFIAVKEKETQLRELYKELSEYAGGVELVSVGDGELLSKVEKLRTILEDVFGQRITFLGEQRPPTVNSIEGTVIANAVLGTAIAVDAEGQVSGEMRGKVEVGIVQQGGTVISVKVKR